MATVRRRFTKRYEFADGRVFEAGSVQELRTDSAEHFDRRGFTEPVKESKPTDPVKGDDVPKKPWSKRGRPRKDA